METFEDPLDEAHIRLIIGRIYNDRGQLELAQQHLRVAVEIAEDEIGPDAPLAVAAMSALGHSYFRASRPEEALEWWKRELDVRSRTSDENDPALLNLMHNLGAYYLKTGSYDEAEPLLQRTLDGRERTLGPDHPSTLATLSNLAVLSDYTGEDEVAERCYRDVLQRRIDTLGPESPRTLVSVNNLADFFVRRERFAKAEPLSRRAYEGLEKVQGSRDPYTIEFGSG